MADGRGAPAWPDDVCSALARFKQGDIVQGLPLFYFGAVEGGLPLATQREAPAEEPSTEIVSNAPPRTREFDVVELSISGSDYTIITTQTCDLNEEGEPAQPFILVAPVYDLSDEAGAVTLQSYLIRLDPPDLPPGVWVADLRVEVLLEKTVLVGRQPLPGFADEEGYLTFASLLGRRKDRAALGAALVDAVAATLRKRLRNNKKFREVVKTEIQSVRLSVPRGTRLAPVEARLHVVARGPIRAETQERFQAWWEVAVEEAEAVGISLLPNEYHDSTAMDVELYERLIDLGI